MTDLRFFLQHVKERTYITPGHAPLLVPTAAFAAGIWCGHAWPGHTLLTAALLAAVSVAACLLRRRVWAVSCVIAAAGTLLLGARWPVESEVALTGEHSFAGRVTEVRRGVTSSRMIAECRADGSDRRLRLLLNLEDVLPVVEEGDSVEFCGTLEDIEAPLVKGEVTAWGFAWERGIRQTVSLTEEEIKVTAHAGGFGAWLADRRGDFSSAVMSCGVELPAAQFLTAVLAGDSGAMDESRRQTFARAGVAHMLALSGTHVGIIVMLAWVLFFPLSLGGYTRLASGGALALLWIYILLTGGAPSAVRAALMASAVAVGQMAGLNRNGINSLCAAALLILVYDPLTLFDIGFLLSVTAVASILLFMPLANEAAEAMGAWVGRGWGRRAVMSVGVCLAAVAGTAPLSAYFFHMFPLLFLVADLIAVPLLPVVMVAGLVATLCHSVGWDAAWLCEAIDWLYGAMEWVCARMAEVPGGVVEGIGFPVWLMLPYYGALWALWMAAARRRLVFAAGAGVLLLFAVVCRTAVIPAWSAVHTETFAPAERYCTAVVARDGRRCYLLTDAGEKERLRLKERLQWRFSRYLLENGIDSIECPDRVTDSRRVFADRRCWAVGGLVITLLGDEESSQLPVKPDILLVTRQFDGDVVEAFRRSGATRAVISPSVYAYRRQHFEAALTAAGIPFTDRLPRGLILKERCQ